LWPAAGSLTLEHAGEPLSCYEAKFEADTGKPRSVGRPRLLGTSAASAQPQLFGLDVHVEPGWLKALRLGGYGAPATSAAAGFVAGRSGSRDRP
jgi:hypothetical protein